MDLDGSTMNMSVLNCESGISLKNNSTATTTDFNVSNPSARISCASGSKIILKSFLGEDLTSSSARAVAILQTFADFGAECMVEGGSVIISGDFSFTLGAFNEELDTNLFAVNYQKTGVGCTR